ncbi:MAG TPA: hypothetical protein VGE50_13385 [Gammaproteobacteria bacterium]
MHNRFIVGVEFSYKGENFQCEAELDLDECMAKLSTIPDLHDLLARRYGIDAYSYQYEVLASEELQFFQVEGFAAEYIHAGVFDGEGFAARWREERSNQLIAEIARRVLGITELAAQPLLKQALFEAYRAGQATPLPEVHS